MKKICSTKFKSIKKLKSLKYHIFAIKHYFFLVFLASVEVKIKKYLKQELEEIHKPLIRNFNKRKVHSSLINNVQSANLDGMQLMHKCNKELRFFIMCY